MRGGCSESKDAIVHLHLFIPVLTGFFVWFVKNQIKKDQHGFYRNKILYLLKVIRYFRAHLKLLLLLMIIKYKMVNVVTQKRTQFFSNDVYIYLRYRE